MSFFTKYLEKQLKNPAFKKEWDASEKEYQQTRQNIEHLTHKSQTKKNPLE